MIPSFLTGWIGRQSQRTFLGALQYGPIPRHVGFIMDGNSRYARDCQLELVEGHNMGYDALVRCLRLCYGAGIECVSVYAFSIETICHNRHAADQLLGMAVTRLSQLVKFDDVIDQFGIKIVFLGDLSLLKPDTASVMEECMKLTSGNTRAVLNVCVPYSSQDEMTRAIVRTVADFSTPIVKSPLNRPVSESRIARSLYMQRLATVKEEDPAELTGPETGAVFTIGNSATDSSESSVCGLSDDDGSTSDMSEDVPKTPSFVSGPSKQTSSTSSSLKVSFPDPGMVDADSITRNTFSPLSPPLDMVIRTSGVNRLSDFMLWQTHQFTQFVVLDTLWPQFGFWDFSKIILEWQWGRKMAASPRPRPSSSISMSAKHASRSSSSASMSARSPSRSSV